jgi:hypothetical protein
MAVKKLINWLPIEQACVGGMDFPTAAITFGEKEDTIRARARRYKWPTPHAVVKRAAALARANTDGALDKGAEEWNQKGESHRVMVFDLANKSLKKMKPRAPINFREAEAADKMARRAAGLETADVQQAVLIQLNESMERAEDEQPIEISATVTPLPVEAETDAA